MHRRLVLGSVEEGTWQMHLPLDLLVHSPASSMILSHGPIAAPASGYLLVRSKGRREKVDYFFS